MRIGRALLIGISLLMPSDLGGCKGRKAETPATPPLCKAALPRPSSLPLIISPNMQAQARLVSGILREYPLRKTEAFRKFKELTADLSDEELAGLAAADVHQFLFNRGLLGNHPLYMSFIPFENPRDYFVFMAFLNAAGKLLMQYDQIIAFRQGNAAGSPAEMEAPLRRPQLFKPDDFLKYLKLFRELFHSAQAYRDVGVFFDHPSYLWAASPLAVRKITNPDPNQGKWIVHTDSLDKGRQMLKSVLVCFDANRLSLVKLDLDPFIPGVYRLIFYADEKDPQIKTIAESVAGKPAMWIYDWQCLEGQTLFNILSTMAMQTAFPEKDKAPPQRLVEAYREIERNPEFFRNLGFSEFQRQVFLRSLFLGENQDLSDPATDIAQGYIRFPPLAWLALPHLKDPKFKPLIQDNLAREKAKKESWQRAGLVWE